MPSKIKKLPGLEPIHYVDVANPTMMKKWLSNSNAHRAWEDAAETASDNNKDVIQLQDLTYKPTNYQKLDPILVGKAMKEYVDLVINDWTEDSNDDTAKVLVASLPLFVEMSKTLPHVNPSEEYKIAFRGTSVTDKTLNQFIKNNQKPGDWVQTSIGSQKYMAYKGPKKRMFNYKPHREAQSWSTSDKAASNFGTAVIATPLDTTFFFDPNFMNQYGHQWEDETIHFGKSPMKVLLLVDKEAYDGFVSDETSTDDDNDKFQKFLDDFYDGNDLAYQINTFMQRKKGDFNWWDNNKKKWAAREKVDGSVATRKYYMQLLNKLTSMPDLNESVVEESMEISDEDGMLTLPL